MAEGTVPKDSLGAPVQPPVVDKLRPVTGLGIVNLEPPRQDGTVGPPFPHPKPAKMGKL
jgi:hypothetical protein